MAQAQKPCTLLINGEGASESRSATLKTMIESGTIEDKKTAMKQIIVLTLNGDKFPQLLFPIIRYIQPVDDDSFKKILYLYWEICDKRGPEGKLLPELILICDSLRKDLTSPNEYVRGAALRFVSKIKEAEILEALISSIIENLNDRHVYVRRCAVLCIYAIYRNFEYLLPDAPDRIFNFLSKESDAPCRRNAFIMLYNSDPEKAVQYLSTVLDEVIGFSDVLQLIVIELIRKVCRSAPSERSKYLRCMFGLLSSSSPAVQFEAATTLVSLTGAPTAVKAAGSAFIKLLVDQSDNNVKMIVLDRLIEVKKHHTKVMQGLVMDILRALNSPNMDVKKKCLDIVLDLISTANVEEVVGYLKKEIYKTQQSGGFEKSVQYRELLVKVIYQCAVRYPNLAGSAVNSLMDYLGDSSADVAEDIISFIREVVETYPELREAILRSLSNNLRIIRAPTVYRAALWILGEYCTTVDLIDTAFSSIKEQIGEMPLVDDNGVVLISPDTHIGLSSSSTSVSGSHNNTTHSAKDNAGIQMTNAVGVTLADGTYASQSAFSEPVTSSVGGSSTDDIRIGGYLRSILLEKSGDVFTSSILATNMTKLVLRSFANQDDGIDVNLKNAFSAQVLLRMVNLLKVYHYKIQESNRLISSGVDSLKTSNGGNNDNNTNSVSSPTGESSTGSTGKKDRKVTTEDDRESVARIWLCIKILGDSKNLGPANISLVTNVFLSQARETFSHILEEKRKTEAEKQKQSLKVLENNIQADDLIRMRQLFPPSRRGDDSNMFENADEETTATLTKLSGAEESSDMSGKLNRLNQLTGMSDPVYAEAFVMVHRYDIVLDVFILNQTDDTLQNLNLELATLGDLKLVERPQNYTIGPNSSINIKANIKVSSTDVGVIFGNIVYDIAGTTESNCVVLNEIAIDIMDYISPSYCSDGEFRRMWTEFEWENKLVVNTQLTSIGEYLERIKKITNMSCLTPEAALKGDCGFLTVNLYAKSVFGEDALANVSLEKIGDKIEGAVRIRSRMQGIALGLGDKITHSLHSVQAFA
eukprot:TRINITY_DN25817_c0_g1_i1.p1 TRINITY_DN25817_c0_g1~~TRINITY_DN25817_c0_g1_i1.p1  ORF type:complete len:1039 (-),score=288.95 TRINITY_DN25817_c0_g1_i1:74-3190(-)